MNKKKKIIIIMCILFIIMSVRIITNKFNNHKIVNIEENQESLILNEINTEKWDLDRVFIAYDSSGKAVPVPIGYTASSLEDEKKIDTGFVIYEGTEEIRNENKDEAQMTRNQYVWIPVYDINDLYGRDIGGIAHGKIYTFDANGRKIHTSWSEDSNKVMLPNGNNSFREPLKELNTTKVSEYLSCEGQLYNEEFEEIILSIEQYGGFYIGRYELGNVATSNPCLVKFNSNIGNQNWTTLKLKCSLLRNNNENIKTAMSYGCMFDRVLQWLVDTGCKTYYEIAVNSEGWGNFSNNAVNYTNSSGDLVKNNGTHLIPTGSSEDTKANNIYDLAGNALEMTLERNGNSTVERGGTYVYAGNYFTAAYRYEGNNISSKGDGDTARAILYIVPSKN